MSSGNRKKHRRQHRGLPVRPSANWVPVPGDLSKVACSKCDFRIEAVRAVETGWSVSEQTGLLYHFCPSCGSRIALSAPDGTGVG